MDSSGAVTDTIAAISTPPGRAGIGIVRLSGPMAASIAAQLVSPRQPLEHAHVLHLLLELLHAHAEPLLDHLFDRRHVLISRP